MMPPDPFNDESQESAIPYFGMNGAALSQEERVNIARRRGVCLTCGTRTHVVRVLGRTPLANDDVYQGICITCNKNSVPASVLQAWQIRNAHVAAVKPVNRLKLAGNAPRVGHGSHPGLVVRPQVPAGAAGMTKSLPGRHSDGYDSGSSDSETNSSRNLNDARSTGTLPTTSLSGSGSVGENFKASGADWLPSLKTIRVNKEGSDIIMAKLHALRDQVPDEPGTLHEIKELMEKYQYDPKFIMVSAGAIWGIVSKGDKKKEEALTEGCIEHLLDAIRNGIAGDDPEAVPWILGALSSLACFKGNRNAITDAKGIEAILHIMKRHERNPCVFEWGCRVLFALLGGYKGDGDAAVAGDMIAVNKESSVTGDVYIRTDGKKVRRVKKSITHYDNVEIITRPDGTKVRRIRKIKPAEDADELTPKAASTSTSTPVETAPVAPSSGLSGFFEPGSSEPRTKYSESESVAGYQHLDGEIYVRPDGKKVRRVRKPSSGAGISSSGPAASTQDMDVDIIIRPDGTKARRIRKNPTTFERQISIIENYGGIRVIVEMMKHHLSESAPILWALRVLLLMQDSEDLNRAARSVQLMNDDDLSDSCIKIINTKVSPYVVLYSQVMLLYLFSRSPNEVIHQQAVDCIPSVLKTMSENPNQPDLVEVSAEFLTNLSRNDFRAKRKIADNNGPKIIVACMTSYSDNLKVQRALVSLLWSLSVDEASFDYSVLAEVKQALEMAAKVHDKDSELDQAICGFVANTITRAKGRQDCVPLELVIQLATSGGAGTQGSRILAAACAAFPDVSNQLTQGGIFERLLEGLRDGKSDVQMGSADSLAAMMIASDAIRSKVYASGGLAMVSTSLNAANFEPLIQSLLKFTNALVAGGSKKVLQLPNDIVQVILQATKSHPTTRKLACTTIRNLMLVTVPGLMAINTDGLVEFLIDVLGNPSNSDDLVIEACGALWACLAKQPNTNADLLSQCFRAVLGLCVRHNGESTDFNGPILTEAAGTLSSVMYRIRDNPFYISDEDIESIVSILDIVKECDVQNFPLMERLMDAIISLCFLSKQVLIQFGVIVVVIDCMVEHESNEMIQQMGFAILALLASTENPQVNRSIAEIDGVDMIVSALTRFTENLVIQTDACRALSHLSIDHEFRMLISSKGGFILLVNAMNRFRNEVDLLEAACSALLNLSSDAEEQALSQSSVVETVVLTMRHQFNSRRLQENCLGVLQNVSIRSRNAKQEIANAGGIGAVIFAIREFIGSPSVLELSFTTMWSLAVLEDNQRRIANEGGISLVINGMMATIEYEEVQKQACGCLCTLSTNSENKTLIRELGGVDAIVYAMWAHYRSDALLIEACRALSSLTVNVQTNEVMIASEGEIGAIMSAMGRFPDSERLQKHACGAIRNLLLSTDNVAIVRPHAPELEKLINAASARFLERCFVSNSGRPAREKHAVVEGSTIMEKNYKTTKCNTSFHSSNFDFGSTIEMASYSQSEMLGCDFTELYETHEKLGSGAQGIVFKCSSKENRRTFAVKIINKDGFIPRRMAMLANELRLLNQINGEAQILSTKIVQVFHAYETPTYTYIVMEQMLGGSLTEWRSKKDPTYVTESDTRLICRSLFEALDYCHQRGIAHRDIKLGNLLLAKPNDLTSLKIANFAFAKVVPQDGLTTRCGTPLFLPPEIVLLSELYKHYDTKCDMWSAGVVVYILLGGMPPFSVAPGVVEGIHDLYQEIILGTIDLDDSNWRMVSKEAKTLIKGLLTKAPRKRWSVKDVLESKWMKTDETSLSTISLFFTSEAFDETSCCCLPRIEDTRGPTQEVPARSIYSDIMDVSRVKLYDRFVDGLRNSSRDAHPNAYTSRQKTGIDMT